MKNQRKIWRNLLQASGQAMYTKEDGKEEDNVSSMYI